ncbi:AAA family ATPase [Allomuricauda sp. F6463D]|uniref:AAA family ATPase n=1 Tax=Allomuricauda sp. F6463D TaxID=2926409 RepID=UPI001FF5DEA8|nr:AAA family ATPase [Muricauda sp. F6463D]MCK0159043.1 AAA family ATPase [Muricauda sp. F6463D]
MNKIEAIQNIKKVGKFVDCQAAGSQFQENTIIYGRNTLGKSTLTAIFRSIKTGDKKIIEGKKSFGIAGNPDIKIRFTDGSTRTILDFNSNQWTTGNPNIQIFDTQFITENVFQGEEITFDNQKSLNQIIIGEKGIDLNSEIQQLQKELNELTEKKRQLTNNFNKLLPSSDYGNITIEKFCAIPETTHLNDQIKAKKEELQRLQNKEVITTTIRKHLSFFSSLSGLDINKILNSRINFNPEEINRHISAHWKNKDASKDFLRQGLDLTKEEKETCVFCGQNLNAKELRLLETYEQFFKGEYQSLQKQVQQTKRKLDSANFENTVNLLNADFEKYSLETELTQEFFEQIILAFDSLKKDFESKFQDLYFIPSNDYDSFFEESLKTLINEIKRVLEKYFPLDGKTISQSQIISEIKDLELQKHRISKAFKDICKEFEQINNSFKNKRTERENKRKELEEYSLEVFGLHKTSINNYLKRMGANFKIDDLQPIKKLKGSDERLFTIKFYDKHLVSLDSENSDIPNFKNSLSESDKRVLAFAFFLSLLKHDDKLDKKILVFDDPFSSFDEERKRDTIQLLADVKYENEGVEKKPLQKIILTHEKTFYRDVYLKSFSDCSTQTLKIDFDKVIDGINTSKITYCYIEEEFPDDKIIAKIKRVKEIHDNQSYGEKYNSDCRVILENIFKRKYYFLLEDAIKSRKSVRTFTTTLEKKYPKEDYKRLLRLCDDLNIELHDNGSEPSNGDHASILRDFFDCIEII